MGSTQMNRDSSRSHTMFSLSIQYQQNSPTKIFRQGKLNFVDLGNFFFFFSTKYFHKKTQNF